MFTRIAQVKQFNYIVDKHGLSPSYTMTTGTGAMYEPRRTRGWVLFQSPKLGDPQDFAKLFNNRKEAELELSVRT